ncbi:MAG: GAF domain-containing protein [Candidatus Abyssobacteria bacterium SURF_17]|uniref:GAF domain-containing protein n=1 Tax=Candidatus Abyssobacteria bacterium SURF_17 TaxID=2093361 RepID=A0A419F9B1_9BACT|nr:MAG: GAF domain-containing protein [Candidatus Abyssubacteria bacterium SURF_17]
MTADELTLLKDIVRSREEEISAHKKSVSEKEAEIKALRQELKETRAKLEEKIERLSTLISVGSSINSTLDLDQLLTYLMACATKVMKAKDSSLMLLDERTNELVFKIALGEKGSQVQEFRLRMGQGIAGQVALTGEPIIVSDAAKDTRFEGSIDAKTGFETKSIMCVPIKLREKVVGVIEVLNAGYSGPLTEEDLDIFSAFASAAGVALQNARLFSAIQHSLEHICDLLNLGALMTDEAGELVMINSIARKLMGFSDAQEVTIGDIGGLKSDKNIASLLQTAFDRSQSLKEEVALGDAGAKRIELNITPVIDPKGMKIGTVAVVGAA